MSLFTTVACMWLLMGYYAPGLPVEGALEGAVRFASTWRAWALLGLLAVPLILVVGQWPTAHLLRDRPTDAPTVALPDREQPGRIALLCALVWAGQWTVGRATPDTSVLQDLRGQQTFVLEVEDQRWTEQLSGVEAACLAQTTLRAGPVQVTPLKDREAWKKLAERFRRELVCDRIAVSELLAERRPPRPSQVTR